MKLRVNCLIIRMCVDRLLSANRTEFISFKIFKARLNLPKGISGQTVSFIKFCNIPSY